MASRRAGSPVKPDVCPGGRRLPLEAGWSWGTGEDFYPQLLQTSFDQTPELQCRNITDR